MTKEQRYFDALQEIATYQSVESLRKHSEDDWGLSYQEALEMAYEGNKLLDSTKGRVDYSRSGGTS